MAAQHTLLAAVVFTHLATLSGQSPARPSDTKLQALQPARPLAAPRATFIENAGQWNGPARFVAHGTSLRAAFEPDTLVISPSPGSQPLRLHFDRAYAGARLEGEAPKPGVYNFFIGRDGSRWRSGVRAWSSVAYRSIYPGVDVRVRDGGSGALEYDVHAAPGATIDRVVLRTDGARRLAIDADGALRIETGDGTLVQRAPRSWEVSRDGTRRTVRARFRLVDQARYGFDVEHHDPALPLVIDPGLEWSTFIGGSGPDFIGPAVVARDGSGDVFVGGTMKSADFPGFNDPSFAPGTQDRAFVARLDATGSVLRYATFLGGWHSQIVRRGLTVDAGGNAVLVGQTFSPDFPVTAAAFDRVNVNKDGFVVRLDPAGGLIFSTFVGGSGEDEAYAAAYDPAGNIIVGGTTASADFPTTSTSFDPSYNAPNAPADGGAHGDMFVVRLTPDGSRLTYGTFIGGPQADVLEDLVVDPQGFVTVAGWVTGNRVSVFVTTADAFDRTWNGSQDAAIARLKLDGRGAADLKYATLFGGASQDNLWKIAIDPTNPELVTFAGRSWSNDYPVTAGVVRPTNPPFSQLFPDVEAGVITRFRFPAAGGGTLVWSTYHHSDRITGVTVNEAGEPIVTGPSAPYDMPTTRGAFDVTVEGPGVTAGAFIGRLSADATQYRYQTFFGGSGGVSDNFQTVPQIARVAGNTVVVSGQTTSNDFPITASAFDAVSSNSIGGGASNEGFVMRLSLDANASGDLTADPPVLTGPADGVTFHNGLLGRLEWSAVADASGVESYEFAVSTRADFAKNFILYRGAVASTDVIVPPSVGNSGGLCTCTFFWRVRTADRAGNLSAWSPARSFTIDSATGLPVVSFVDIFPRSSLSSGVSGGSHATGMLHLYDPAPAGGLVARLTAVHDRSQGLDRTRTLPVPVTVPDTVTIPAGALSASFPITTSTVTMTMGVSIVATVNGIGSSGSMSVTAGEGPNPSSVTLVPGSITGGTPVTGTVTIDRFAPAGGTTVSLSTSHPAAASVPATVTIPQGQASASFPITTHQVDTDMDVGITAARGGATSGRPLYVRPPGRLPTLTGMTISPATVAGGGQSGGTLTFSGPFPLGTWPALPDAVVRFTSSDPDTAAVFGSDEYVLAGSTSQPFRIFTFGVPQARTVTLTAWFDGVSKSGVLTVNPVTGVTLSSFTANVTTMRGGEGGVATVSLGAPAPASLRLQLATNHPELLASMPSSLVISSGSTSGSFAFVTGTNVTSTTPVTITASYGASAANLGLTVNPAASATPPLTGLTIAPASVAGGAGATGSVTLQGPAPSGGASVQLSSSNTAAATVPPTVTVTAGATSASFPITSRAVTTDTSVVISALLQLSAEAMLTVTPGGGGTPPPAPSAPALVAPSSGATVTLPVTLDWSDVTAAASYQVQVDDSSTFSSPLVVDQSTTASQLTVSSLAARQHWWRVRGINSAGTAGAWSSVRSFTPDSGTPPPPPPPAQSATLTVKATGRSGERVTSSPSGINVAVGSTGSASFTTGTSITLTVSNGRDAIWSGACSSGGSKRRSCTFTFTQAATVTAQVQ